ncbi:MAG: DUF4114 domain-containing protein [Myxococcota bacterium]
MPRPLVLAFALATACNEYELSAGKDTDDDAGETGASATDTGRTPGGGPGGGAGDDGPDDTGRPDTGPGDPGEDPCYEPEDGYEQNAAARLITTDGTTPVTVTLHESDSGYDNDLLLDAPESILLLREYADPIGTTTQVGPWSAIVEIVFGIDVRDTGDHFKSGPASRNDDGIVHVAVTYEGGCAWLIGFEDIRGGGDQDFNDVVLRVEGMLRQER